ALWKRLEERGWIYQGTYEGWYSVRDEAFYQPDEISTTPSGEKRAPSGAPVEWVKEPSFFFKLAEMQKPLLDFYDANPGCVLPQSRFNEVRSFVAGGLKDLSVSRTSFSWGIPVPGHPKHIMYVWIDALINYIAALGYPDEKAALYKKFWPGLHMVGKDILRFHAVYWPAFLMAAGLRPPVRVFAHGWWTNEGEKISKSLGNVIDPFQLVEEFGLDPVRYFLMREVPFGNDGDFSRKAFIHRNDGDLANDLGNLAQRTLTQIARNCGGKMPSGKGLQSADTALLKKIEAGLKTVRGHMEVEAIHLYLEEVWALIAAANGYISAEQPWSLKKDDPKRMAAVLYTTAEALRRIALLVQPVMPDSAARLLDQLGVGKGKRTLAFIGAKGALKPGTKLPEPKALFPRLAVKA
ncbi:MAG TPA: methionine--tRNA ligase, partial [Sphingomonadales bacterium]|nr:methionine--tRNA ligase [Sphingomonadales bacterium]